ncbi:hypothetical protein QQF64_031895 [Cirrhinus molitorella]|uniref:Uncharacterized protein n=1 Tax=Cirrhinus molitorella TaxID=172907 RepID=A0ABR3MY86_9TELE
MYGLLRPCFRLRRFEPQIHLSAARLSREKPGCSRAPSMGSAFSRSSSVFLSPLSLCYSRFRPFISKRL